MKLLDKRVHCSTKNEKISPSEQFWISFSTTTRMELSIFYLFEYLAKKGQQMATAYPRRFFALLLDGFARHPETRGSSQYLSQESHTEERLSHMD